MEDTITCRYRGWAMREDEEEEYQRVKSIYERILSFRSAIKLSVRHRGMTMVDFSLTIDKEHEHGEKAIKTMTPFYALIYADRGNVCFGGHCTKINDTHYSGTYYTD